MVTEKNSGSNHDFLKDPIRLLVDGDWLTADGTTLGADNGIGVSAALALLDREIIDRPPRRGVALRALPKSTKNEAKRLLSSSSAVCCSHMRKTFVARARADRTDAPGPQEYPGRE